MRPLRLFALFLILTFLSQELVLAAPMSSGPAPAAALTQQAHANMTIKDLIQDPSRMDIPSEHAQLKEFHKGTNQKLIIHIQDAHANYSGQKNLADTLDHLMSKYGISLVLAEGGEGDVSLSPIRRKMAPAELAQAARRLLLGGMIAGAEYLDLVSNHSMKIVGIEEDKLYRQNLEAYSSLAGERKEVLRYLSEIGIVIDRLRNKLYPRELLEYEAASRRHDADTDFLQGFEGLLELAGHTPGVDADAYPQMQKLRAIRLKEKGINFESANLEQAKLWHHLSTTGSRDTIRDVAAVYKKAGLSQATRHRLLENLLSLAEEIGISSASLPELTRYRDTLGDFNRLEFDSLFRELELFENAVYWDRLTDENAKTLRMIDQYVCLLKKAYEIQMTSHEFDALQKSLRDFPTQNMEGFLNGQLAGQEYFENLIGYRPLLEESRESMERFYRLVGERDKAFVHNIKTVMTDLNEEASFLVAGGYHTDHLMRLLREEGYSYAVLTPVIKHETDHAKYENILLAPIRQARRTTDGNARERRFVTKPRNNGSSLNALTAVLSTMADAEARFHEFRETLKTGLGSRAVIELMNYLDELRASHASLVQGTRTAAEDDPHDVHRHMKRKDYRFVLGGTTISLRFKWYENLLLEIDRSEKKSHGVVRIYPKGDKDSPYSLEIRRKGKNLIIDYHDTLRKTAPAKRSIAPIRDLNNPETTTNLGLLERYPSGLAFLDRWMELEGSGQARADSIERFLDRIEAALANHLNRPGEPVLDRLSTQDYVHFGNVRIGLEMRSFEDGGTVAPLYFKRDRIGSARFEVIRNGVSPESPRIVLEQTKNGVISWGTKKRRLKANTVFPIRDFEEFSRHLNRFKVHETRVDTTSPEGRTVATMNLFHNTKSGKSDMSVVPLDDESIERVMLSSFIRINAEERTIIVVDKKKLPIDPSEPDELPESGSGPVSALDEVRASQGKWIAVPVHEGWSYPKWMGERRDGELLFYYRVGRIDVGPAPDTESYVTYERLEPHDSDLRIFVSPEGAFSIEGILYNGKAVWFDVGKLNLPAFLYVLLSEDGYLSPIPDDFKKNLSIDPKITRKHLLDIDELADRRRGSLPRTFLISEGRLFFGDMANKQWGFVRDAEIEQKRRQLAEKLRTTRELLQEIVNRTGSRLTRGSILKFIRRQVQRIHHLDIPGRALDVIQHPVSRRMTFYGVVILGLFFVGKFTGLFELLGAIRSYYFTDTDAETVQVDLREKWKTSGILWLDETQTKVLSQPLFVRRIDQALTELSLSSRIKRGYLDKIHTIRAFHPAGSGGYPDTDTVELRVATKRDSGLTYPRITIRSEEIHQKRDISDMGDALYDGQPGELDAHREMRFLLSISPMAIFNLGLIILAVIVAASHERSQARYQDKRNREVARRESERPRQANEDDLTGTRIANDTIEGWINHTQEVHDSLRDWVISNESLSLASWKDPKEHIVQKIFHERLEKVLPYLAGALDDFDIVSLLRLARQAQSSTEHGEHLRRVIVRIDSVKRLIGEAMDSLDQAMTQMSSEVGTRYDGRSTSELLIRKLQHVEETIRQMQTAGEEPGPAAMGSHSATGTRVADMLKGQNKYPDSNLREWARLGIRRAWEVEPHWVPPDNIDWLAQSGRTLQEFTRSLKVDNRWKSKENHLAVYQALNLSLQSDAEDEREAGRELFDLISSSGTEVSEDPAVYTRSLGDGKGEFTYIQGGSTLGPTEGFDSIVRAAFAYHENVRSLEGKVIFDLGTAHGGIPIAFAKNLNPEVVYGFEINGDYRDLFELHRFLNGVPPDKVRFVESNYFDGLSEEIKADLIVINPPQRLARNESDKESEHVKQGRDQFFVSDDEDGLHTIRRMLEKARLRLKEDGAVLLQILDRIENFDEVIVPMLDVLGFGHRDIVDEASEVYVDIRGNFPHERVLLAEQRMRQESLFPDFGRSRDKLMWQNTARFTKAVWPLLSPVLAHPATQGLLKEFAPHMKPPVRYRFYRKHGLTGEMIPISTQQARQLVAEGKPAYRRFRTLVLYPKESVDTKTTRSGTRLATVGDFMVKALEDVYFAGISDQKKRIVAVYGGDMMHAVHGRLFESQRLNVLRAANVEFTLADVAFGAAQMYGRAVVSATYGVGANPVLSEMEKAVFEGLSIVFIGSAHPRLPDAISGNTAWLHAGSHPTADTWDPDADIKKAQDLDIPVFRMDLSMEPEELAEQFQNGIQTAIRTQRPVYIRMQLGVIRRELPQSVLEYMAPDWGEFLSEPDRDRLIQQAADVYEQFRESSNSAIYVGGALPRHLNTLVEEVSQKLNVLLTVSWSAKGFVHEDLPTYGGPYLGEMSADNALTKKYMDQADFVLRLAPHPVNAFIDGAGSVRFPENSVTVKRTQEYPRGSDIKFFLKELLRHVKDGRHQSEYHVPSFDLKLQFATQILNGVDKLDRFQPIAWDSLHQVLGFYNIKSSSKRLVYLVDPSTVWFSAMLMPLAEHQSIFSNWPYGQMGVAAGQAMAAALSQSAIPVVLDGDGGWAMKGDGLLNEFLRLKEIGLVHHAIFVVFDNQSLELGKPDISREFQEAAYRTFPEDMDLVASYNARGALAIGADNVGELLAAMKDAEENPGIHVIIAKVSQDSPLSNVHKAYAERAKAALRQGDHEAMLKHSVKTLYVSERLRTQIQNVFEREGIVTLGDLVAKTEDELLGYQNFGNKSLIEVKERLQHLDLELAPAGTRVKTGPIAVRVTAARITKAKAVKSLTRALAMLERYRHQLQNEVQDNWGSSYDLPRFILRERLSLIRRNMDDADIPQNEEAWKQFIGHFVAWSFVSNTLGFRNSKELENRFESVLSEADPVLADGIRAILRNAIANQWHIEVARNEVNMHARHPVHREIFGDRPIWVYPPSAFKPDDPRIDESMTIRIRKEPPIQWDLDKLLASDDWYIQSLGRSVQAGYFGVDQAAKYIGITGDYVSFDILKGRFWFDFHGAQRREFEYAILKRPSGTKSLDLRPFRVRKSQSTARAMQTRLLDDIHHSMTFGDWFTGAHDRQDESVVAVEGVPLVQLELSNAGDMQKLYTFIQSWSSHFTANMGTGVSLPRVEVIQDVRNEEIWGAKSMRVVLRTEGLDKFFKYKPDVLANVVEAMTHSRDPLSMFIQDEGRYLSKDNLVVTLFERIHAVNEPRYKLLIELKKPEERDAKIQAGPLKSSERIHLSLTKPASVSFSGVQFDVHADATAGRMYVLLPDNQQIYLNPGDEKDIGWSSTRPNKLLVDKEEIVMDLPAEGVHFPDDGKLTQDNLDDQGIDHWSITEEDLDRVGRGDGAIEDYARRRRTVRLRFKNEGREGLLSIENLDDFDSKSGPFVSGMVESAVEAPSFFELNTNSLIDRSRGSGFHTGTRTAAGGESAGLHLDPENYVDRAFVSAMEVLERIETENTDLAKAREIFFNAPEIPRGFWADMSEENRLWFLANHAVLDAVQVPLQDLMRLRIKHLRKNAYSVDGNGQVRSLDGLWSNYYMRTNKLLGRLASQEEVLEFLWDSQSMGDTYRQYRNSYETKRSEFLAQSGTSRGFWEGTTGEVRAKFAAEHVQRLNSVKGIETTVSALSRRHIDLAVWPIDGGGMKSLKGLWDYHYYKLLSELMAKKGISRQEAVKKVDAVQVMKALKKDIGVLDLSIRYDKRTHRKGAAWVEGAYDEDIIRKRLLRLAQWSFESKERPVGRFTSRERIFLFDQVREGNPAAISVLRAFYHHPALKLINPLRPQDEIRELRDLIDEDISRMIQRFAMRGLYLPVDEKDRLTGLLPGDETRYFNFTVFVRSRTQDVIDRYDRRKKRTDAQKTRPDPVKERAEYLLDLLRSPDFEDVRDSFSAQDLIKHSLTIRDDENHHVLEKGPFSIIETDLSLTEAVRSALRYAVDVNEIEIDDYSEPEGTKALYYLVYDPDEPQYSERESSDDVIVTGNEAGSSFERVTGVRASMEDIIHEIRQVALARGDTNRAELARLIYDPKNPEGLIRFAEGVARRFFSGSHDAIENAAQEAITAIYVDISTRDRGQNLIAQYNGERPPKAFLRAVIANKIRGLLRTANAITRKDVREADLNMRNQDGSTYRLDPADSALSALDSQVFKEDINLVLAYLKTEDHIFSIPFKLARGLSLRNDELAELYHQDVQIVNRAMGLIDEGYENERIAQQTSLSVRNIENFRIYASENADKPKVRQDEIARMMDTNANTIRGRIHKVSNDIQRLISESGHAKRSVLKIAIDKKLDNESQKELAHAILRGETLDSLADHRRSRMTHIERNRSIGDGVEGRLWTGLNNALANLDPIFAETMKHILNQNRRARIHGTRTPAQEKFEEFFGNEATGVLEFVAGSDDLSKIAEYSGPHLAIEPYIAGNMRRVTYMHEVRIEHSEAITFYTKRYESTLTQEGLIREDFDFEREAETTNEAYLLDVGPATKHLASTRSIAIRQVDGEPLDKFLQNLPTQDLDILKPVIDAIATALGRLHTKTYQGDLVEMDISLTSSIAGSAHVVKTPAWGHIYIKQEPDGSFRVRFIDFGRRPPAYENSDDPQSLEYDDLLEALTTHFDTVADEMGPIFEESYRRGRSPTGTRAAQVLAFLPGYAGFLKAHFKEDEPVPATSVEQLETLRAGILGLIGESDLPGINAKYKKFSEFVNTEQTADLTLHRMKYINEVLNREVFRPSGFLVTLSLEVTGSEEGDAPFGYVIDVARIEDKKSVSVAFEDGREIRIPAYILTQLDPIDPNQPLKDRHKKTLGRFDEYENHVVVYVERNRENLEEFLEGVNWIINALENIAKKTKRKAVGTKSRYSEAKDLLKVFVRKLARKQTAQEASHVAETLIHEAGHAALNYYVGRFDSLDDASAAKAADILHRIDEAGVYAHDPLREDPRTASQEDAGSGHLDLVLHPDGGLKNLMTSMDDSDVDLLSPRVLAAAHELYAYYNTITHLDVPVETLVKNVIMTDDTGVNINRESFLSRTPEGFAGGLLRRELYKDFLDRNAALPERLRPITFMSGVLTNKQDTRRVVRNLVRRELSHKLVSTTYQVHDETVPVTQLTRRTQTDSDETRRRVESIEIELKEAADPSNKRHKTKTKTRLKEIIPIWNRLSISGKLDLARLGPANLKADAMIAIIQDDLGGEKVSLQTPVKVAFLNVLKETVSSGTRASDKGIDPDSILYRPHTLSIVMPNPFRRDDEVESLFRVLDQVVAVDLGPGEKTVQIGDKTQTVDLGEKGIVTKEILIVIDQRPDHPIVEKYRTILDQKKAEIEKRGNIRVRILQHAKNMGKGGALRTAINAATGEYFVVQDTDEEYKPQDLPVLVAPLISGKANVVYGKRQNELLQYPVLYFGSYAITLLRNILYPFSRVGDDSTGYKLSRTEIIKPMLLYGNKFVLEPEWTSKWAKWGYAAWNTLISPYRARSKEEGKAIRWQDGLIWGWTIIKYRFVPKKWFVNPELPYWDFWQPNTVESFETDDLIRELKRVTSKSHWKRKPGAFLKEARRNEIIGRAIRLSFERDDAEIIQDALAQLVSSPDTASGLHPHAEQVIESVLAGARSRRPRRPGKLRKAVQAVHTESFRDRIRGAYESLRNESVSLPDHVDSDEFWEEVDRRLSKKANLRQAVRSDNQTPGALKALLGDSTARAERRPDGAIRRVLDELTLGNIPANRLYVLLAIIYESDMNAQEETLGGTSIALIHKTKQEVEKDMGMTTALQAKVSLNTDEIERRRKIRRFIRDVYHPFYHNRLVNGQTETDLDAIQKPLEALLETLGTSLEALKEKYRHITEAFEDNSLATYDRALYLNLILNREIFIPNRYYYLLGFSPESVEGGFVLQLADIIERKVVETAVNNGTHALRIPLMILQWKKAPGFYKDGESKMAAFAMDGVIAISEDVLSASTAEADHHVNILETFAVDRGYDLDSEGLSDVLVEVYEGSQKIHPVYKAGLLKAVWDRMRPRRGEIRRSILNAYLGQETGHILVELFHDRKPMDPLGAAEKYGLRVMVGAETAHTSDEFQHDASRSIFGDNAQNNALYRQMQETEDIGDKLVLYTSANEAVALANQILNDDLLYHSIIKEMNAVATAEDPDEKPESDDPYAVILNPGAAHRNAARFLAKSWSEVATQAGLTFDKAQALLGHALLHPDIAKDWTREVIRTRFNPALLTQITVHEGELDAAELVMGARLVEERAAPSAETIGTRLPDRPIQMSNDLSRFENSQKKAFLDGKIPVLAELYDPQGTFQRIYIPGDARYRGNDSPDYAPGQWIVAYRIVPKKRAFRFDRKDWFTISKHAGTVAAAYFRVKNGKLELMDVRLELEPNQENGTWARMPEQRSVPDGAAFEFDSEGKRLGWHANFKTGDLWASPAGREFKVFKVLPEGRPEFRWANGKDDEGWFFMTDHKKYGILSTIRTTDDESRLVHGKGVLVDARLIHDADGAKILPRNSTPDGAAQILEGDSPVRWFSPRHNAFGHSRPDQVIVIQKKLDSSGRFNYAGIGGSKWIAKFGTQYQGHTIELRFLHESSSSMRLIKAAHLANERGEDPGPLRLSDQKFMNILREGLADDVRTANNEILPFEQTGSRSASLGVGLPGFVRKVTEALILGSAVLLGTAAYAQESASFPQGAVHMHDPALGGVVELRMEHGMLQVFDPEKETYLPLPFKESDIEAYKLNRAFKNSVPDEAFSEPRLTEKAIDKSHQSARALFYQAREFIEGRGVVIPLDDFRGDPKLSLQEDLTLIGNLKALKIIAGFVRSHGGRIAVEGSPALMDFIRTSDMDLAPVLDMQPLPRDMPKTLMGTRTTLLKRGLKAGEIPFVIRRQEPGLLMRRRAEVLASFGLHNINDSYIRHIANLTGSPREVVGDVLKRLGSGSADDATLKEAEKYTSLPPIRKVPLLDFVGHMMKLAGKILTWA